MTPADGAAGVSKPPLPSNIESFGIEAEIRSKCAELVADEGQSTAQIVCPGERISAGASFRPSSSDR
jgi:hypothetical protein